MKLIILDRDGVINYESPEYIKSPEEWKPVPGSLSAIARLTQAGYTVTVATNQSGVSRGLYTEQMLASIHRKMHNAVCSAGGKIDLVVHCPHHPDEGCSHRKPQPGMLLQIAQQLNCPLSQVPFVGDRKTDVQTALTAGATPILVGKNGVAIANEFDQTIAVYTDLAAVVDALLKERDS